MAIPKRILFVQTQAENAGAQEISRLLGKELAKRGHDVHHLFFYRKTDGFDGQENTTICCDKRPSGPFQMLGFFKKLVADIKAVKPDVVFTFQHFGNTVGAPAAKLAGVPLIVANQVSARETIHPVLRYSDLLFGLSGLYHAITVNSHDLLKDYSVFPKRYTNKIVLVPHGFEEKTTSLSKDEARAKYGIPTKVPLLGTVARLNEAKQIDCAIKLLEDKLDWHLLIAGQGPDEDRLKALVDELQAGERTHFIGEVSQNNIGDVLKSLDLFVFPSRAETFGLAAVEAGQAGIPIVANDLPVLREVLDIDGDAAAHFVDVKDQSAFANTVANILSDKMTYARLSNNGQQLKNKYSLDHMVDVYDKLTIGEATS